MSGAYDDVTDTALIDEARGEKVAHWRALLLALAERLEMRHRDLYELERAYAESVHTHLLLDGEIRNTEYTNEK